jgi:catechol 2,3-dioxygenase-like lactoylglutathione lyase family enzyme
LAIIGIESLVYGVEDVAACTQFFDDFGLPLQSQSPAVSTFVLEEGSKVVLRHMNDRTLPSTVMAGPGVREVVWGVDTADGLKELADDLRRDREIVEDADGVVHFKTDCGLPFALRVFAKRRIVTAPDPVNAAATVNRLNRPRKWRLRARPKVINHVVFNVIDVEKSFAFVRDRLQFRATDFQRGFGIYARCDGAQQHHNLFFVNASLPFPGFDGKPRFNHANFGVEDIDEIMVGANHMERCGWPKSVLGLGRHRIDSALFFYLPSPAGGEAEYGADADCIDDGWVPRDWINPLFGYLTFAHNVPPFFMEPPSWDVQFHADFSPPSKFHGHDLVVGREGDGKV